jgi:hypothetical protein
MVEGKESKMKIDILHAGYCTAPEHIAIHGGRWRTIHFPAMFALFRHPNSARCFSTRAIPIVSSMRRKNSQTHLSLDDPRHISKKKISL